MSCDPKIRFGDRVENYKKYRPDYPAQIIPFLKEHCAIDNTWSIADIGSGTGISTNFLITGLNCHVHAIEPNSKMQSEADATLGLNPFYRSTNGSAESTTLPDSSVNMVAAFQAFHWFEKEMAAQEFKRILKNPKHILFVWNDRVITGSGFAEGYEAILRDLPEYGRVTHKNISMDQLQEFTKDHNIKTAVYSNAQRFDFEGLKGRFFSSSYTPAFGTDAYYLQIDKLRNLFDRCNTGGFVEFEYRTEVFLAEMK